MHAGQHRDNATSAASVFLFDENRHRQPPPGTRDRKRRPPCISRYNLQQRRGVAQSGSASALGAEGRGFESLRPDHLTSSLSISLTESQGWDTNWDTNLPWESPMQVNITKRVD